MEQAFGGFPFTFFSGVFYKYFTRHAGRLYGGPEVDVWSCGVVLFAMLCGSLPFDDENIPRLFKKIRSGAFAFPATAHVDPRARDLIRRMLHKDQLERIKIEDIWKHPWFTADLPPYLVALRVRACGLSVPGIFLSEIVQLTQKIGSCSI